MQGATRTLSTPPFLFFLLLFFFVRLGCFMRASACSALSGAVIAMSFVRLASAAQLNSTIEWSSCADLNPAYGNFSDSLRCGYYDVPLDWADESVGTARLAVARYPAADGEKKGTIFFNPGAHLSNYIVRILADLRSQVVPGNLASTSLSAERNQSWCHSSAPVTIL